VVEHLTFNQVVVGSIPTGPTKDIKYRDAVKNLVKAIAEHRRRITDVYAAQLNGAK
jgi:hypothetical protein